MPILKEAMSFLLSGFRPISITPVTLKTYERLISSRLCVFMESEGDFPRHQYTFRKGLESCDAMLEIVCAGQETLELALVLFDFSAAFDPVSHSGILHKLRDVGVGDAVVDIIAGFVSGKVYRIVVDGVFRENFMVNSGVPHGSVLDTLRVFFCPLVICRSF